MDRKIHLLLNGHFKLTRNDSHRPTYTLSGVNVSREEQISHITVGHWQTQNQGSYVNRIKPLSAQDHWTQFWSTQLRKR